MQSIAVISQELKIQSFTLSPTEIIPGNEQRKDLNGEACALVKVQVVDDIDRVEGNFIGDIERRGMEKRIYLTKGTKMFRLYPHGHLPVNIITGDYNIEKLEGNHVYILRLVGDNDEKKEKQKLVEFREKSPQKQIGTSLNQTFDSIIHYKKYPVGTGKVNHVSDSRFIFNVGIGFNAINLMGPSVNLGVRYKMFSLEGGFVYGLDKVENVSLTLQGSTSLSEAYDYSCSKVWAGIGFNFNYEQFRITPQIGATFNMISGKSLTTSGTDYFKDSNPMSIFAALRLSYEVVDHLRIHVTPQYDFSLNGDQIFTVIKEADNKIKSWGEGFGINAGVIYEF